MHNWVVTVRLLPSPETPVNEMSLMKEKEDLDDENINVDDIDYINEGNAKNKKHHLILEQRNDDDDENLMNIIGGKNGANAVMAGRIAGLIPVASPNMRHEDEDLEKNNDLLLSYDQFKAMTNKDEEEAKETEKEEDEVELSGLAKEEMSEILEEWLQQTTVLGRSNQEHKVAILTCVLYLADAFCDHDERTASDFSVVIQGSGGTGKTHSVICAVKEFVDFVCNKTEDNE